MVLFSDNLIMLRFRCISIVFILVATHSFSQELVDNGDFELGLCPETRKIDVSQVCDNWFTIHTADYFSKCSEGEVNTKNNFMGSQNPYSGIAYVGIFSGKDIKQHISEILYTELITPLEKGNFYKISFRYSLAENAGLVSKALGCAFSSEFAYKVVDSPLGIGHSPLFNLNFNIYESNVEGLLDDTTWSLFEKEFVATGGEQYLYISGVQVNSISCTKRVPQPKLHYYSDYAYYYIDDVSLVERNIDGSYPVLKTDTNKINLEKEEYVYTQIYYGINSYELNDSSRNKLDALAIILKENSVWKIAVQGYADVTGQESENKILSDKRANSVKTYLITKGIKENQIETKAFGSMKSSELGNVYDRKVEIFIIKE
jgi:outer membrane protein OmpA-like peptidoglycan-associated protein